MSTLFVVATPIGNLKDISKRTLEILKNSDLILAEDTRHTVKLTNYFNIKTKMLSYHKFNEKQRSQEVIDKMVKKSLNVALVSDAGTPCISDPGSEIVKTARENGIEVIGIPGVSAVITALSISGMDVSSFVFKGFFPKKNKDRQQIIDNMTNNDENIYVFYESPKRIIKFAEYISDKIPTADGCFCCDLTKLHERTITGNIKDICTKLKNNDKSNLGEYTVVLDISKHIEKDNEEEKLTVEAKLIDAMVKTECTLKDAIKLVKDNNPKLSKREIYNSSLELKEIFK